jgi:hypothetical protein
MQRKIYALVALVLALGFGAKAQTNTGTLQGKVVDKDTKEPLPLVTVIVMLNGNTVNGASTDFDGKFTIKPIDPGSYDVQFAYVGYSTQTIKGIPISSGKIAFCDAELTPSESLTTVEIVDYKVPLIDKDGGASGGTVTRDQIKAMPGRSALGFATTVAGVSTSGTGGGISIRGARTGSTWIYIDGIKVRGSSSVPKSAIEEVSVITGGVPANIGDATGGVINISLRNSSKSYTGGIEVITSGIKNGEGTIGLDHSGYNLVEGSLSGPLLWKKDDKGERVKPILGFFLSGNYNDIVDPNPAYGGSYRMKEDVRQQLIANPLRQNRQQDGSVNGALFNADFLGSNDFEKIKTRLNVRNRSASIVAKIDVSPGENMTLTFGGTAAFDRGHDYNRSASLMNWENNQLSTNLDWRAYAKFSQRFKNAEGEESTASTLKNVYYSVMVDYSRSFSKSEDDTHKDELFKYGHVGYFDVIRGNTYEFNGSYYKQTGIQNLHVFYKPSPYNPELGSVNNQFFGLFGENDLVNSVMYDNDGNLITDHNDIYITNGAISEAVGDDPYSSITNITGGSGLQNGTNNNDGDNVIPTYNLWDYIGNQSNGYSIFSNSQFRVSGAGSADIGDHALQLGFEYEQRNDAGYSISPVGLWILARLRTNEHIRQLNTGSAGTIVNVGTNYYQYFDQIKGNNQYEFDYNLRKSLGLDPRGTDYINVDNIDPENLDVSMFGAEDLLVQGNNIVNYYGYDHTGKRITGRKPTIEDFFNQTYQLDASLGADGRRYTRPIGSFQPIYTSGYIMDKFAFEDLIFNVGVRIDRYDANQPVPKDPFVINEAYSAGEVDFSDKFTNYTKPSNIGDDFVVYVNDVRNPSSVTGFRSGNTWYNSQGQVVSDPTLIFSGGKINPYLKTDPQATLTSNAFKDYTPAVNVMPRVAFSFPISDEATFFAHYDILTQRPITSNRFNPIDYLYMQNRNVLINNPALKPEKTVDYALGFQQVLSKTSSIKVEAFYRELRNMIQVRSFIGAYPSSYRAFDNLDFGTVKGLTLTYDLRRTGNFWMRASYTLQFADGTGSSTQSQLALINAGFPNLRTVAPFNYDQRHRIVTTFDYHYGEGSDYTGPVWFGKRVFENTGVNMIANLGSGTPYTPQKFATPITGELSPSTEGSINGARLPWQFSVDMNLDRNFSLKFGKEGDKRKSANLNIYLWITNLFNSRNVNGVYRFTGVSDDDGYLAAAQFQPLINQQNNPSSFRNYYSMLANNPYNLGTPRQIRLGIRFDF